MPDPVFASWFVVAAAVVYGLIFGSFINVVIYRWPREMSLWKPRSHCPGCGALVHWYDNVPLLSYAVLLGRCRQCKAPISPRYPLVEALSGALCGLVAWQFGLSLAGVQAAVLVLLLIPLGFIDLEHKLLPDVLTLPGIVLGLLGSWAGALATPLDALLGAALGGLIPYLVIVVYRWLRGVEGMGLGDVKLLAMVGAFLGWREMLLTLSLGATLGALVGVGMIVFGRGGRDTELPFGSFLTVAALVALFWGPRLLWLLGWSWP
jgi:leader peptidase (prepilin peptidase) / N-methyltransferase